MVVAILGQDFNFVVLSFGFSHPFFSLSHPVFKKALLYSMTKRTASAAFPAAPPTDPAPTALSVFVALSPTQFHQLETDQPIIPDPFSERFGLCTHRLKALERAHYFTNWTPPKEAQDAYPPIHQKQFVLCKLLTTPLGYTTLCEEGILVKGDGRDHFRQGYYQWYGLLYRKRWASEGKKDTLLWVIEDEYEMIS